MDGPFQMVSDRLGFRNGHGIFGDSLDHSDDIGLLIAELSDPAYQTVGLHHGLALHLPGDHDHRNRVRPGPENAVHGIDTPGTRRDIDDAGLAADPRIAFRRDRTGLLVMAADAMESALHSNGIVEVHGAPAGNQKDMVESLVGKGSENIVCETDHNLDSAPISGQF